MDKEMTIDPKLEEALKNLWDSMTDEQKEKAKACKNMDIYYIILLLIVVYSQFIWD